MEPTYEIPTGATLVPTTPEPVRPPKPRSRRKAAMGGLLLAALLATGTTSVFAASPEPSATTNAPAATDEATESSGKAADRADCPKDAGTDTDASE